ncbi:hypothetical protein HK096_003186 [Nowakowskiella sp. JEL0078]|nr:hypothetical protein HK096_003186 [Nowakowskiella sp. JEL0078]
MQHRKYLQPAFGPVFLRETCSVTLENIEKLMSIYEKRFKSGNPTTDVMKDFTLLTGDVIGRIAFDTQFGYIDSLVNGKEEAFNTHMEHLVSSVQSRQAIPESLIGILAPSIKSDLTYIFGLLEKAISNKKELLKQAKANNQKNFSQDMLSRLLSTDGVQFTEEEIKSEAFAFFLAGHETSANTITWIILELVSNPRVLKKLQLDIDEAYGSAQPTYESLNSSKYLEAVVKEAMRLHAVATQLIRTATKDNILEFYDGNSIEVKKGTTILIQFNSLHRNKKYWGEDADVFTPERWLVKNSVDSDVYIPIPGSYMPFCEGQHNCIGQKIALVEIKTVLIRLLQKYDISLSSKQGPLVPIATMTLGLKSGLLVELKPRAA